MHHLYTTDAFVLNTSYLGEADSYITLYTKDLGLIRAKATGIRYLKSKLRFAVQPYSHIQAVLVRGKGIWRLTNAQFIEQAKAEMPEKQFLVLARVFSLIERLVQGEEPEEKLYESVLQAYSYLKNQEIKEEQLLNIECVLVLRILNHLGYIGDTKNISFFTLENKWDNEIISKMEEDRKDVLQEINRALRESQL